MFCGFLGRQDRNPKRLRQESGIAASLVRSALLLGFLGLQGFYEYNMKGFGVVFLGGEGFGV